MISGSSGLDSGLGMRSGSRSAILHPFGRRAYLNSIAFSAVELKKYFWLLTVAEPELWHYWPNQQYMKEMVVVRDAGLPLVPNPGTTSALTVPRICLGKSLLEAAASDKCCTCLDERPDSRCNTCDRARNSLLKNCNLRFYSVQQCEEIFRPYERKQDHGDVEYHTQPLYRIVVTGSADAAAAQAFYDAGANGISTLFTCAMMEWVGEKMREFKGPDAFERVDRLWKLSETIAGPGGNKHKIFY